MNVLWSMAFRFRQESSNGVSKVLEYVQEHGIFCTIEGQNLPKQRVGNGRAKSTTSSIIAEKHLKAGCVVAEQLLVMLIFQRVSSEDLKSNVQ